MLALDTVIGSGGVLSHAPLRSQAALMMIDGFGLEGVTQLAVDSIFMLPHLGVLSSVHPAAAQEIFERDCVVYIGVSVVPVYPKNFKRGTVLADIFINDTKQGEVIAGEVDRFVSSDRALEARLKIVPKHRQVDVGVGAGKVIERIVRLGAEGVICDGRNRPFSPDSFTISAQRDVYQRLGLINESGVSGSRGGAL
jgi:hypothetical protein